jgi:hypothetical protein
LLQDEIAGGYTLDAGALVAKYDPQKQGLLLNRVKIKMTPSLSLQSMIHKNKDCYSVADPATSISSSERVLQSMIHKNKDCYSVADPATSISSSERVLQSMIHKNKDCYA